MKIFPVIWCALFFVGGGLSRSAEMATAQLLTKMTVDAEAQEDFGRKYPDLADEREVVAQAARALVEEGAAPRTEIASAEALAERSRALLARRTPQEWQHKAVNLFPELGVAGSELNALFLRHHAELQRNSPQFLQEPSWPVLLARRCADELRAPPAVAVTEPPGPSSGVATETVASAKPPSLLRFWGSLLSVALLLAIIVQPARWLFRYRRALAGLDVPVTLWPQALRPAAWAYLAVALLALFRTFSANADQGSFDRFGITLLVSLLAGLAIVPLALAAALGVAWVRRREVPRSSMPNPAPESPAVTLPGHSAAK